jgi:L-alanine-DL-glutamate epimerase-like enolase superfamily enzyme
LAQPQGILVAPHNWSSLLSLFMQVHVGLAIPNFYRAEVDPVGSDILIYDDYRIEDGLCSVPDAPGFGLTLDEDKFSRLRVNFDLKA